MRFPSRLASDESIQRDAARTQNESANNVKPSVINAEKCAGSDASLNSFASEEAIELPGSNNFAEMLYALPITKVTAIVSPSARPRPSMMPPITPTLVYGSTTFHTTSHVVAPRRA